MWAITGQLICSSVVLCSALVVCLNCPVFLISCWQHKRMDLVCKCKHFYLFSSELVELGFYMLPGNPANYWTQIQQTLVAAESTAQIIAEWIAHKKKKAIQIIFRTLHKHHHTHVDSHIGWFKYCIVLYGLICHTRGGTHNFSLKFLCWTGKDLMALAIKCTQWILIRILTLKLFR